MFVIDQDGKFLNQKANSIPGYFQTYRVSRFTCENDKLELLYMRILKKYSNLL